MKKRIHYYGIEITAVLFDYDNYPSYTDKRLYLQNRSRMKRFKTRKLAEQYLEETLNLKQNHIYE